MNDLINIKNENGINLVSARELHEKLGSKERFSKWFERMIEYGFNIDLDFTPYKNVHPQNKQEIQDYFLKIDMAKQICMLQRSKIGIEIRKYFIECENKLRDTHSTQFQRLYERSPQELLSDNAIALNKMFEVMKLNIPKEIIVSTAIHETKNSIGYDFPEVQKLLTKQEEESYHTKSEICKKVGIKANKVNDSLIELDIQKKGSSTLQPYILTENGKQYGVERVYTTNGHQGYEIKLKSNSEEYLKKNLNKLPIDWLKKSKEVK